MSNARFSILQSKAVEDSRISNAQFRTLAALGTFGDKEGWCFPKLKTIAAMLNKSKQAVNSDLQHLRDLGYVEIYAQYREDGGRMSNKYRLIFDTPTPRKDSIDARKDGIDTPSIPGVDTPSTSDLDTPSIPGVDALTPHNNATNNATKEKDTIPISEILAAWAELFPGKSQPRPATYRKKIEARWKEQEFRDNWYKALQTAARSPTCQKESWFCFEFFVTNDKNYIKMLDDWMAWKDTQEYGKRPEPAAPKAMPQEPKLKQVDWGN